MTTTLKIAEISNAPTSFEVEVSQYSRPESDGSSQINACKTREGDWIVYLEPSKVKNTIA